MDGYTCSCEISFERLAAAGVCLLVVGVDRLCDADQVKPILLGQAEPVTRVTFRVAAPFKAGDAVA